jgi:ribonuclease HI
MKLATITIYTDGGCSGNPGPGAWAAVVLYNGKKVEIGGSEKNTTNNRMELLAVIKALQEIHPSCQEECKQIDIYTDSQYVQKGISEWIVNWLKKDWHNSAKKPVKNKDLWQELLSLTEKLPLTWHWIKGHAENEYNNACDKRVKQEIKKLKLR